MTVPSLNVLEAHGVVRRSSPLDPNPFQLLLFGNKDAPLMRQLVDVREVGALLDALAPHVLAVVNDVDQAKHAVAVTALREIFRPAPAIESPPPPSVVLA